MIIVKKIKITLTSGNVLEKPLIIAFKGTYGDYAVLDNESVGSMGLPVILISKIDGSKLNIINDANEWNAIKENLRNIIAGNQVIKVNTLDEYNADDIYYKQLTLPVASFDALKKFGTDETASSASVEQPMANNNEVTAEPTNVNPMETPVAPAPEAPVAPQIEAPTPSAIPNPSEAPMPNEGINLGAPLNPVNDMQAPVNEAPVQGPIAPEAPQMDEVNIEPIPNVNEQANNINFAEEKAIFLQACENMFDALVSKFSK